MNLITALCVSELYASILQKQSSFLNVNKMVEFRFHVKGKTLIVIYEEMSRELCPATFEGLGMVFNTKGRKE